MNEKTKEDAEASITPEELKEYYDSTKVTWAAVIICAMVAFGLTFLFNLFTFGVSLSVSTHTDTKLLALTGFWWTFIGSFILFFIAGWVSGRQIQVPFCQNVFFEKTLPRKEKMAFMEVLGGKLSFCPRCHGMLHGFLGWVLYLFIALLFSILIAQFSASSAGKAIINSPFTFFNNTSENSPSESKYNDQNETGIKSENIEKAGIGTLALFLIFSVGMVGSTLGCYGGFITKKHKFMRN